MSDPIETLRVRLGLPVTATDAEIRTAAVARIDELEAGRASAARRRPTRPTTVVIPTAQLEELQARAEDGRRWTEELGRRERDDLLDDAIAAGKFPRSMRETYRRLYDVDDVGTRAELARLPAGLIPKHLR